jgi:hypothetical protein
MAAFAWMFLFSVFVSSTATVLLIAVLTACVALWDFVTGLITG